MKYNQTEKLKWKESMKEYQIEKRCQNEMAKKWSKINTQNQNLKKNLIRKRKQDSKYFDPILDRFKNKKKDIQYAKAKLKPKTFKNYHNNKSFRFFF